MGIFIHSVHGNTLQIFVFIFQRNISHQFEIWWKI